jgi:hypothetical protein
MPQASLKFLFSSRPPLSCRLTGLHQIADEPRKTLMSQKSIEEIKTPEANVSEAATYDRKFQLASFIQMFLGLFAMVLISFLGQDSGLDVISIGEGIIAGFLYIIISLLSLYLRK